MSEFQDATVGTRRSGRDQLLPFAVDALDVRGRIVRLDESLNTLLQRQNYPPIVSKLLGQAIALTAMLAGSIKLEGQFILQAQTDGPVSLMVVDMRASGDFRATAKFDEMRVAELDGIADADLGKLLGKGTLALTIDQGKHMNRYQGFVELHGGSLEEAAHNYFQRSEQLPTKIRLAVSEMISRQEDGSSSHFWQASGMMMQFLPQSQERIAHRDLPAGGVEDEEYLAGLPAEDDSWVEAVALMDTLDDRELADPDLESERLLFRLFHERGVRVFDPQSLQENCSCSEEKLRSVLVQLSEEDRRESAAETGMIEAKCDFCGREYRFDPASF